MLSKTNLSCLIDCMVAASLAAAAFSIGLAIVLSAGEL